MVTLLVNGRVVMVDDAFLDLPPRLKEAFVQSPRPDDSR
jgi:hypothetical protein